jgi:hypothetical protein
MTFTEIARPMDQATNPFWPEERMRLRVQLVIMGARLVALGFDPDLSDTRTVFTADLRPGQDDAFLSAVKAGIAGRPIAAPSNDNVSADSNTVVVVDPGSGPGDGKGPKVPSYYTIDLAG